MVYRRLSDRKADKKRLALEREWMTLVEAIGSIKSIDSESETEARPPFEQICDAIEEGELGARWLDRAPSPSDGSSMLWTPDEPISFVGHIRKKGFLPKNGGQIHWGRRYWRTLLLSRDDMCIFKPSASAGPTRASTQEIQQLSNNKSGDLTWVSWTKLCERMSLERS